MEPYRVILASKRLSRLASRRPEKLSPDTVRAVVVHGAAEPFGHAGQRTFAAAVRLHLGVPNRHGAVSVPYYVIIRYFFPK